MGSRRIAFLRFDSGHGNSNNTFVWGTNVTSNPYYQDDWATIYHGDCREILPTLTFDVIVTDPPYGIDLDTDYSNIARAGKVGTGKLHAKVIGDADPFDPSWLLATGVPLALFGPNHYAHHLPLGGGWHVWDKREHLGSNMLADFEMWWTSYSSGPSRIFRHMWLGYMRRSEQGNYDHPTRKPLSLMVHVMSDRLPAGIILDPYAGTGTTLRAAKDLGRKSIGVEIDEAYCEIAAKRLAQEVLDFGSVA